MPDRKSTRLNSSHLGISYAVFCLKKKKKKKKKNKEHKRVSLSTVTRTTYRHINCVSIVFAAYLCFLASFFFFFFFFFFFLNDRAPPNFSPFPLPAPFPICFSVSILPGKVWGWSFPGARATKPNG